MNIDIPVAVAFALNCQGTQIIYGGSVSIHTIFPCGLGGDAGSGVGRQKCVFPNATFITRLT